MTKFFLHFGLAVLISVIFLYLYAFACYGVLRVRYKGRERLSKFLESKFKFFAFRLSQINKIVTTEIVRKSASNGWGVLALTPVAIFRAIDQISIGESFNVWWLATALLLPFFGGVFFAMSWMGRYAMNELQIEQYGEDEFRMPEKMTEQ